MRPSAHAFGLPTPDVFLSNRAGRVGWSSADAAYILGMLQLVFPSAEHCFSVVQLLPADDEQECAASARVATSSAYLLEAAGSGVGGILASIVLLRFLGSFQIATVVAVMNLCMAAILLFRMSVQTAWGRRCGSRAFRGCSRHRRSPYICCSGVGQVGAGAPVAGIPPDGIARLDLRQPER